MPLKRFILKLELIKRITADINARIRDGPAPANHTKKTIAASSKKSAIFLLAILLDIKKASPPNKLKCIPERARMCERPAFRKASDRTGSVYSLDAVKSVSRRPPASPHPYISLLN